MYAQLPFRERKASQMRDHQIHQQQSSNDVTAREDDGSFGPQNHGIRDEPTLEVAGLRLVKAFVHLRQRSDEHQHETDAQQDDRELQRIKKFQDFFNHSDMSPFARI